MQLTPQRLDPRILEGLGLIVIQSASLDGFLQEFVSYLVQAHRSSMYVITQSVSISSQSNWARTLVIDAVPEPIKEEALELLSHCDEIRAERNAYVHGIWKLGPEPRTALVQTVRLDRPEILKDELVTLADLSQLSADLEDATKAFAHLAERLGFAQF